MLVSAALLGFEPAWKNQASLMGQSLSGGMNFFRLANGGMCSLSPCSAVDAAGGGVASGEPVARWPPAVRARHLDAVPVALARLRRLPTRRRCRRSRSASADPTGWRGTWPARPAGACRRCRWPTRTPTGASAAPGSAIAGCLGRPGGPRRPTAHHFSHWLQHIQPNISGMPSSSAISTMCSPGNLPSSRSMLSPRSLT